MSQVKYEQSRRDFKEKDAKGDKFDKKWITLKNKVTYLMSGEDHT
jgi:hypothetical protein